MGWTLAEVRHLTVTDYDEIVRWLQDEADRAQHGGEGAIDMGALIEERTRKDE